MKKFLRMLGVAVLMVVLCYPGTVVAADVLWQLQWQDDGSLQDEVQVQGREIANPDSSWKSSQEGNTQILLRETPDWSSYQKLPDRLPLQVKERNFVFGQITYLSITAPPTEGMWQQLQGLSGFQITIGAPGYIKDVSAEKWAENELTWEAANTQTWIQTGSLARIVTVDGFLSAVAIVLLAMLLIGIKFLNQMKKADQIIAEEFALVPLDSGASEQPDTQ